jgi:hypothetical protein
MGSPWLLVLLAFQIWMLVDALRRGEHLWAIFIFLFPLVNAILYYFLVYRQAPAATQGFELPGTHKRQRIKALQAQIHHLDKAHHHAELGDIYFQAGKLKEAESSYRAAIERDGQDIDFQAHLGQCLLRQGRAGEARPLLETAISQNPKHDYGHTMMAYAEALTELGEKDQALKVWETVLDQHAYARARVQAAELAFEKGDRERAREGLISFLADEVHTSGFDRRRDRYWVKRARALLKKMR